MDANTDKSRQMVVDRYNLTPHELGVADNARTFLDDMFIKFGIPLEMKVTDYISHLRTQGDDFMKLFGGTMADVLRKSGAPGKIDEFFKHWRENDFAEFVMDQDALSVMLKYSNMGHRSLYMNPVLDKLKKYINVSVREGGLDTVVAKRMRDYVDTSMGLHTPNEEALIRAVQQFGEKIAPGHAELFKNMYQLMYSMGYTAMMGWRPFGAIRNLFQIWSTLAPRFGNAATLRAVEMVMKDPETIMESLKRSGIIAETLPVAGN
jgi:hypothetical protein